MKHWDLVPGETVTLRPVFTDRKVTGIFRARDTRSAWIENAEGNWIEYALSDNGDLASGGRVYKIAGPERHTRSIVREPAGQREHFTLTEESVRRAVAGGRT